MKPSIADFYTIHAFSLRIFTLLLVQCWRASHIIAGRVPGFSGGGVGRRFSFKSRMEIKICLT